MMSPVIATVSVSAADGCGAVSGASAACLVSLPVAGFFAPGVDGVQAAASVVTHKRNDKMKVGFMAGEVLCC